MQYVPSLPGGRNWFFLRVFDLSVYFVSYFLQSVMRHWIGLEVSSSFSITYNMLVCGCTGKLDSDGSGCPSLGKLKKVLILMYLISLIFFPVPVLFEQFFTGIHANLLIVIWVMILGWWSVTLEAPQLDWTLHVWFWKLHPWK